MSPVRRLLVALAAPTVLLAASGCSEPAGPTQDQYTARADSICDATDEKIDELYMAQAVAELQAASTGESGTYVDRPERWFRAKIIPEYERMAGSLRGIQPPEDDQTYLADLYADLDRRIEVLHNRPGDGRALVEDDEGLRDRFESYGMETCPPVLDEEPDHEDPAKVLEAAAEAAAATTTEPQGE